MTDKTPPYVTTFDQIKPGQLIEREWVFEGIRYRAEGIARHLSPNLGGEWCTADGGVVASDKGAETLRVLAEPPKPALPTEGYIEAWGTLLYSTVDVHLVIAKLNADGYWYGLTEDGNSYYLPADRITRWKPSRIVPADDPTAPKSDDGLRERLEKVMYAYQADYSESCGSYGCYSAQDVYGDLRDLLLTDGADR